MAEPPAEDSVDSPELAQVQESDSVVVDENSLELAQEQESDPVVVDEISPELAQEQESDPVMVDENSTELAQQQESDPVVVGDNSPGLAQQQESDSVVVNEDSPELAQQQEADPVVVDAIAADSNDQQGADSDHPLEEEISGGDVAPEVTAAEQRAAVKDDAGQDNLNQAESPVSVEQVEVKVEAATPAVSGDGNAGLFQALDMTPLEKSVAAESSKPNVLASRPRAESRRQTGSFLEAGTRAERFKEMVRKARNNAKKDRLAEGSKSVFQVHMDHIGALGIGMQLYFMLTKYLSVVFLCMGIISLPAIMVNSYGHGITSKMVDPLQLAYSSIGNGGVNSDTAATPRSCLPIGDIDCTWETVDTPLTSNPNTVTWIVTITDVLYSFVFMCFLLFYSYRAKKAIKEHQNKHLTPARYAVMVRGLPRDATEKEIMEHFNNLYDLTKAEEYSKLWFGMCWGKRNKVKRSRSKKAINRSVVSNVNHLEGFTTISKDLYLNSWIAEVSVAHPTGGLLRTFLKMQHLDQKKKELDDLIDQLEKEKSQSLADFSAADEKLIHASKKKLLKVEDQFKKKTQKIKALKGVLPESNEAVEKKKLKEEKNLNTLSSKQKLAAAAKSSTRASKQKLAAAAKAAKTAATNTQQAFDWDGCECAFVVFNNLESRRRCLQDYRQSARWLARKWQPSILRFRNGTYPLIVTSAPEPSNILWENLEVTERGRFYRQFVTNLVTAMLLIISCAIISAAQSAQEQFASKMPPEGLCDRSLPAVYFADTSFTVNTTTRRSISWSLAWDPTANCSLGESGDSRYHIAYTNGITNDLDSSRLSYGSADPDPTRCVEPCISESSTQECNTLPCFYYDELVESGGKTCETYEASHVLYCYCSSTLTASINENGFVEGPKKLWSNIPCRGYIKDYLIKNSFILLAAGIVVVVNFLLDNILRMFAVFERHTSDSTRTIRVAVRMFVAQFLNTALIVIIVNASFGLRGVPVAKELLGGKYKDFQRGWYPTVGMGIATTMLLNAFLPQFTLFAQMYIWSPVYRWYKRRSIRTQHKMDKLYAGPKFDISERYPMVLNSVFVTMVFCGGVPVLLFIGAVASAGIYWFDKLSILHLYSVRTTYDEILGEVTIQALPWTLALHLAFSAWMYGNTELLKGTMLNLPWLLKSVGLSSVVRDNPNATSDQLYAILTDKIGKYDVLGQYGFLVKIVFSHVLLMTVLCFIVVVGLLLYTIFGRLVFVVIGQMLALMKQVALFPVELIHSLFVKDDSESLPKETDSLQQKEKLPVVMLPEFTEPFVMSVSKKYKPDETLGFQKNTFDNTEELTCVWPEDEVTGNIVTRVAGERKLTWETMQAPVKSYAIEANDNYKLVVKRITESWAQVKEARRNEHAPEPVALGKVMPMLGNQYEHQVENAVAATDMIMVVTKKDEDPADAPAEDARPEETANSAELEQTRIDAPVSDELTSNNDEAAPDTADAGSDDVAELEDASAAGPVNAENEQNEEGDAAQNDDVE
ncbi:unnamed protein product [Phytophthora fragariaefolia]|uniref:Unnamed protein product n=1 Tax=Phytophthora fragariaefolia TaxID=1490495 RepID=A0A9W6WV56_9STRA|nr:unnamed protein product [Phytophthora fragariaefolia]